MEAVVTEQVVQFGMAGLIGLLWLLERRHSSQRERELSESHQRLLSQKESLAELMVVVRESTAAMEAVERGQAALAEACNRISWALEGRGGQAG